MSSEYERLIDAARAVVTAWENKSPLAWQPDNNRKLLDDLAAALPPASPAPAKGVRCFRAADQYRFTWSADRLRWNGSVVEGVQANGDTKVTDWTLHDCEQQVRDGFWVECSDSPYVAPVVKESLTVAPPVAVTVGTRAELVSGLTNVMAERGDAIAEAVQTGPIVAAPAPAMPPEGTRWNAQQETGSYWQVISGRLVFWSESAQVWSDSKHTPEWLDANRGPRIPPTPAPAVDSAEQAAQRFAEDVWVHIVGINTGSEARDARRILVSTLTHFLTARDAAISAAKDRELDAAKDCRALAHAKDQVSELKAELAAKDRTIKSLQDTLQGKDDAIAELEIDAADARKVYETELKDLESRLSSQPAAAVDKLGMQIRFRELEGDWFADVIHGSARALAKVPSAALSDRGQG